MAYHRKQLQYEVIFKIESHGKIVISAQDQAKATSLFKAISMRELLEHITFRKPTVIKAVVEKTV